MSLRQNRKANAAVILGQLFSLLPVRMSLRQTNRRKRGQVERLKAHEAAHENEGFIPTVTRHGRR